MLTILILLLLNVAIYLYLKTKNHEQPDSKPRRADGDTLQRKSRDYRGIPSHFYGSMDEDKHRIIRTHFGCLDREPKD